VTRLNSKRGKPKAVSTFLITGVSGEFGHAVEEKALAAGHYLVGTCLQADRPALTDSLAEH
jgi:NADPH-dependent curcumin reductase CurA